MSYKQIHHKRLLQNLNPGDRIRFNRTLYNHWGIYEGDENIIHVGKYKGKKGTVQRDNFWNVVGHDIADKNNGRDFYWRPRPKEEIVKAARASLGTNVDYDVLTENCEHFVNRCRHGEDVSDQADKLICALAAGGLIAGIRLALAAAAPVKKEARKKKVRIGAMALGAVTGFTMHAAAMNAAKKAYKRNKTVRRNECLTRLGATAAGAGIGWCVGAAMTNY